MRRAFTTIETGGYAARNLDTLPAGLQNPPTVQVARLITTMRVMETYMRYCPLVQRAKNIKLLKTFEQTGQVSIPIADWLYFFEALTFLNRDGCHREIYCAFAGEYLLFSKTPIKPKAKKELAQGELFE